MPFSLANKILHENDPRFLVLKSVFSEIRDRTLWFVRIENSLKTQKYENHLNDILGCLFNQFLHELNDIELFLQYSRLKN